jgi:hypothetical protein
MKYFFYVAIALSVSACTPKIQAPIQGSEDSNANQLRVGMSLARVGTIIGEYQNESFDASTGEYACRSYQYDEMIDVKYVHVKYWNDKVVSVTDGHKSICRHPGDI